MSLYSLAKKAGHHTSPSSIATHTPSNIEAEKTFYNSPNSDSFVGFLLFSGADPLDRASTVHPWAWAVSSSPWSLSTDTKQLLTGQHSPELAPTICNFKLLCERLREGERESEQRE